MKQKGIMLMAFLLTTILFKSEAQNIDATSSHVNFSISNLKFKTVSGNFTGMKGQVNFYPENLQESSISACIETSSVNTGNKKRDKHLNNADYFDSEKYPQICFSSKRITQTNENEFVVVGELEMHGVRKEVEIPFSYCKQTLTGSFTVNRLDFGIGGKGTFMVGNEVKLDITCKLKQP
jgi:polyisoprenoid-binding protein YceI